MNEASLLELRDARIDLDEGPSLEGLSAESRADRLALIGAWQGLFALLGGLGTLVRGEVRLAGEDARGAVVAGRVGVGLLDPPLLPEATGAEWLETSLCIGGASRRDARDAARDALLRLGLGALATRRTRTLALPERRALAVAHALLGNPPLIVLESPLDGLDSHARAYVDVVVERARAERRSIVSARALEPTGPERTLLLRSDEIWLLERGALVCSSAADAAELRTGASRYTLTVTQNGAAFLERLAQAGIAVEALPVLAIGTSLRLVAVLPEGAGTELFLDAALAVEAPIIEMLPVG